MNAGYFADQPLVSIGIPSFQRETFIGQAIRSAMEQTHKNIEILVSDNASTDRSLRIADELAREDKRIRVFSQKKNQGPTLNFAFVLAQARGDFFLWLGDDDWIDPNYVERCLGRLLAEPSIAACGGVPVYYCDGEIPFEGVRFNLRHPSPYLRIFSYLRLVSDNGIFYSVIRKHYLESITIRNKMGWDWILFSALACHGGLVTDPTTRVHRRLGGATASFAQITKTMGLPEWNSRFPYFVISMGLASEIMSNGRAFPGLGIFRRLAYSTGLVWCLFRYKTLRAFLGRVKS